MYRTALRTTPTSALRGLGPKCLKHAGSRRLASTASPADKPRTWKGSALRWGLAVGAVYYYNTSSVFAEEPAPQTVAAPSSFAESDLPTVDSVLEEKRRQIHDKVEKPKSTKTTPENDSKASASTAEQNQATEEEGGPAQGVGALEEEAGQQGAFNPETGEINWDCPCLGGMAHGPCGEEFKTAFSCFVYSEEEPKGMDCIEKFQAMQGCFRQYPEIYGAELGDEEDEGAATDVDAGVAAKDAVSEPPVAEVQALREQPPQAVAAQGNKLETDNLPGAKPANGNVPTKWEDATAANGEANDQKHGEKGEQKEQKE